MVSGEYIHNLHLFYQIDQCNLLLRERMRRNRHQLLKIKRDQFLKIKGKDI